jgi:hypothetical protein
VSYQQNQTTERRAGRVRFFHGATRVGVVFFDGRAAAFPADPFLRVGLAAGDSFVMVVTREGKKVTAVAITPMPPPRVPLAAVGRVTPKVYDRVGRGLVTRKKPELLGCTQVESRATVPAGRPGSRS